MKTIKKINSRACGGLTFVEIMISVAVLGLAVVGFYKMSALTVGTLNLSFDRTTAIFLAEEKLAELRFVNADVPVSSEKVNKNGIEYTIKSGIVDKVLPFNTQDETGLALINADPSNPSFFAKGYLISISVEWGEPMKFETLAEFVPYAM